MTVEPSVYPAYENAFAALEKLEDKHGRKKVNDVYVACRAKHSILESVRLTEEHFNAIS